MAGQYVQHINQPARQRAVCLGAGAEAAVHCGAFSRGEAACEVADGVGIDAAACSDALRRICLHRCFDVGHAVRVFRQPSEAHELFIEQRVHHAEQEEHVGARTDEVMLIGRHRGFGAARIDRHNASAARTHRLGLAAIVGHRPQAAVRHHGIGADNQQEVGAFDIRYRERQPVAEHQPDGELLGHLVQRRCGKHVLRAEHAAEPGCIQQ